MHRTPRGGAGGSARARYGSPGLTRTARLSASSCSGWDGSDKSSQLERRMTWDRSNDGRQVHDHFCFARLGGDASSPRPDLGWTVQAMTQARPRLEHVRAGWSRCASTSTAKRVLDLVRVKTAEGTGRAE